MTQEVTSAVEGMAKAFEEFKATNDLKIAELEKKGSVDPLVEDKIKKIEATLDNHEDINQEVTLQKKSMEQVNEKLEHLETMLKRPEAGMEAKSVDITTKAFDSYLRKGKDAMEADEVKALTVGDSSAAGYLAPNEYVRELIKTLTEISPMRSIARVRTTTSKAIEIPSRTATFSAQWVSEQGTRSETTGYTTKLELIPTHEVYALVDISEQMLEDSAFNLESEMQTEFADQLGKAEGTAFVTGSSVGQPEGFITNSSVGTTVTGHASTLQGDGLIDLVHAIKSPYGQNATFCFNRSTLGEIRQLKDSAGQYVFQAGMMLTSGVPNTVLGYPYVEMPDMADVGAGNKPIAFGDWSKGYTVVDRVNLSVLRDPFTQATSGNIRYVARKRVGGQVVLAEALRIQTVSA